MAEIQNITESWEDHEGTEVEEFQEKMPFILLFEHRQLANTAFGLALLLSYVAVHAQVVDYGARV